MPSDHPRQRLARRQDHEVGVSVALCTFNGARWLPELLQSLAAQELLPGELVVQDDGSTDATLEVIEAARSYLPFPIRLEVNEARLGSTRNFEAALGRCHGKVVALADQDDVWYPHKLARMHLEFDLDPTVTMVFSDADLIDESGQQIGRRLWDSRMIGRVLRTHAVVAGDMFARRALTTGCTMALRRRAVAASLPFPGVLADDETPMRHDRWLSLIAAGVGTAKPLPEPLLAFRVHPSQETGVLTRSQLAKALGRVAVRAVVHPHDSEVESGDVRADQLDAAAERAEEFGDFEGAVRLRDVSNHHRRRRLGGEALPERLSAVRIGVRTHMYDADALGLGALIADTARALRPRPRRSFHEEGA